MPRYKITIAYDGTAYCGWQKQPRGDTVESRIEEALRRVLGEAVDVIGQGRTDSGVHAQGQTAHFDFPEKLEPKMMLSAFLGVLPRDIAVWKMEEADADFHARFHAKARRYRYQIALRPMPLLRSTSEMILGDLHMDAMQKCAGEIKGTRHFDSFTKAGSDTKGSLCEVTASLFSQKGDLLVYHIEANRFVRHMVRRLVGTMIQVGRGKRTVNEFIEMIHHPRSGITAHGAPAKGLILEEVIY